MIKTISFKQVILQMRIAFAFPLKTYCQKKFKCWSSLQQLPTFCSICSNRKCDSEPLFFFLFFWNFLMCSAGFYLNCLAVSELQQTRGWQFKALVSHPCCRSRRIDTQLVAWLLCWSGRTRQFSLPCLLAITARWITPVSACLAQDTLGWSQS